jgi:hypothetical protein
MKLTTLLLTLLLIGCGAKTLNKEQTKTDSTAVATQIIKTDSTSTDSTSIKFNVATEEIIIESVDTTKPIEIINNDGKVTKYKNARISHKKRKDNTIVVNQKKVAEMSVNLATNEISLTKVEDKLHKDRPQFNWGTFILQLWWLWLLIILAIYLAYRYAKGKFKLPLLGVVYY